jgi:WD40 repeat protein
VIGTSIFCFLSDNSLKSIDLANDKAVLHYKLIINPNSQLISQSSQQLVKDNLIRVSTRADRLFLRSAPGRIQEINLFSGINSEHSIVTRNYVSRLDKHLPSPHQVTEICLSRDNEHLAVAVQGIGCRSLRFYTFEGSELKLTSKVENCHSGQDSISLCNLSDNRFLSYTTSDSNVKVWKLSTRRKESMLEIDEQFWCCEYEIAFRQQLPKFVCVNEGRVVITFAQELISFVLFHQFRTRARRALRECTLWRMRSKAGKWWLWLGSNKSFSSS